MVTCFDVARKRLAVAPAVSLLRGGMRNSIEGCLVQSFYISETNIRRLRDSAGDARGLGCPGWREFTKGRCDRCKVRDDVMEQGS